MKPLHLSILALAFASGCVTLNAHPLKTPKSWAAVRSAEECQLWLLMPLLTVEGRPTIAGAAEKLTEGGVPLDLIGVEQNLYWYVLAGKSCVTAYGESRAASGTPGASTVTPSATLAEGR